MIIQKLSMLLKTKSIKEQLHCEKSVWRFHMQKHVEKEHLEKEWPTEAIISKAEKGILQKKQARVANALSVKDL